MNFCFNIYDNSLHTIVKANGYHLKSIKPGGMSPVEVVPSNRVILSPLLYNKPNKVHPHLGGKQIIVQNIADRPSDNKLQEKSNIETGICRGENQKEYKNIKPKREAKSACELRRKSRYSPKKE